MKANEIRGHLTIKGVRAVWLAEQAGVTRHHIFAVINRKRKSQRIEALIAQALGMPVEQVFPDRVSKK